MGSSSSSDEEEPEQAQAGEGGLAPLSPQYVVPDMDLWVPARQSTRGAGGWLGCPTASPSPLKGSSGSKEASTTPTAPGEERSPAQAPARAHSPVPRTAQASHLADTQPAGAEKQAPEVGQAPGAPWEVHSRRSPGRVLGDHAAAGPQSSCNHNMLLLAELWRAVRGGGLVGEACIFPSLLTVSWTWLNGHLGLEAFLKHFTPKAGWGRAEAAVGGAPFPAMSLHTGDPFWGGPLHRLGPSVAHGGLPVLVFAMSGPGRRPGSGRVCGAIRVEQAGLSWEALVVTVDTEATDRAKGLAPAAAHSVSPWAGALPRGAAVSLRS